MIRRFRLEQKSHFEKLVIAQRLSDMLDKFLSGRQAPLEIGAETGGIEEWDDVVIHHDRNCFEHLQIKRQATDFCTKNPDKTKQQVKKPRNGPSQTEPTKSVIDSAFTSLARHADLGTFNSSPNRKFQLVLIGPHLKIKDELTVNHLDELCKLCCQDGLNLNELANRSDGPTQRAYLWLTTWCGFKDWAQIRDTLCRVTIVCVGNEAALEQRATESLGRHFSDPKRTLEQLITYITAETSDVSALECNAVVRELKDALRPDIETWVQYLLGDEILPTGKSWSFAGTHDLGGAASESAQAVVDHMWNSEPKNRKLRIYAPYAPPIGANLTLPSALLRLALHLPNGSQSLMLGASIWSSNVNHEIGHTFGYTETDLIHLPWLENPEPLDCIQVREFKTLSEARDEANALSTAMDNLLWLRLTQSIYKKLGSISDTDLADAMAKVWARWSNKFTEYPESRREFLEQLLYPKTEGKNAQHALRLGLRTLDLIVTAVETLLLVAVGISSDDAEWNSFPDYGQVLSIALKCWSGPAGSASEVRELSDDSLMNIIGTSPSPVVILSGVSSSPCELLNMGMADDAETATSMAVERQPHLLVTRSGIFKHLHGGSLNSVRKFFTQQWKDRQQARESAIEKNTKGP